jgi:hypothetical protein
VRERCVKVIVGLNVTSKVRWPLVGESKVCNGGCRPTVSWLSPYCLMAISAARFDSQVRGYKTFDRTGTYIIPFLLSFRFLRYWNLRSLRLVHCFVPAVILSKAPILRTVVLLPLFIGTAVYPAIATLLLLLSIFGKKLDFA